jgi:hypothetical protein
VIYSRGYDLLRNYLGICPTEIKYSDRNPILIGTVRFLPKQPIGLVIEITTENAVAQAWHLQMKLAYTSSITLNNQSGM